jgi:hypothetical protein
MYNISTLYDLLHLLALPHQVLIMFFLGTLSIHDAIRGWNLTAPRSEIRLAKDMIMN